ncbi:hypothetical protein FISHEDRAFT_38467, partial [Fistulina hepatica ATCC 64428]
FQPKKRLVPSEPSQHVIFLGLDPDFTEADLQAYLKSQGCHVESVTIIRERSSGTSPGFGFAQFATTDHARAFVDPLFPFISVPPPASHGASATAAFYKALSTGVQNTGGRRVKIDYSQSASPHEKGRLTRGNTNDGTRDIGNTQGPVLLVRGLDPLSGPQAIHQAMRYSSGFGREGAKGMKRIILIKDKVTTNSFGFGFIEFIDVLSASAVLAATMDPKIHPEGFRISDRPVAVSFAHANSFMPVADVMLRDEASIKSSMSLGGVEGTFVRYWDESATVAVLEFKVEEPTQTTLSKEKEKKKKKVELPAIKPVKPAAPSALPISSKPLAFNFNKGAPKTAAGELLLIPIGFSMDDGSNDTTEEDEMSMDNRAAASKKVAPMVASKKIADNISKWNHVQEELSNSTTGGSVAPASSLVCSSPVPPAPSDEDLDFADVSGKACLLCSRQFKSPEQLLRHNKESGLHKARAKETAKQKLRARQQKAAAAATTSGAEQQLPKYRDRASERRVLFNQPEVPLPESSSMGKRRYYEGPAAPPLPPPAPVHPGEDESNIGNKLLKMMGWQAGTGLGVDGEGRVDPIQTAVYAQGVGLGASKGKEIGKYTEGYSGYVHMAQDSVSCYFLYPPRCS